MSNHLDKVKAHAKKELASERTKTRSHADLIKLYKRFLKIEEHRIKMLHNAGAGGFEICRKRSDLLDVVLKNLFSSAVADLPDDFDKKVGLVAHGGYGRALLNPGSDIDLLFLTRDSGSKLDKRASEVIEKVLYMLWDVGFKVGHATRSIKESIRQANDDTQTKSAIMESRLIVGDDKHFANFRQEFRKHCIDGFKKEYLEDRLADIKSRYAKYSNTVYLQEPHVKNGLGALRDFHNITWISYVERGTLDLRDLSKEGILSNRARRDLDRAHDFLLRVRNDLHYTEKRATDTLTLRLQGVVATNFDYPPQKDILRRCENFMRDYYSHTRNMSMHTTSLLERFELEQEEDSSAGQRIVNFLTLRKPKVERFDGFVAKNGWLYPENSKIFKEDSNRLVRAYLHIQQRNLRMSPQLRQAIKRNWSLIDKPFRYRKSVFESFEAILCRKGDVSRTLRIMHRSGFLGRYLPEFGALTCLVQHEFFHRYTADEHTLKCVDELDRLSDTKDEKLTFYQDLFHKIEDPFPLYLALILHDAGRAANEKTHADVSVEIANRVCSRLSVRPDRRRLVNFLVDNHLTLYITATKKNIADPQVIEEFAHIVRNKHYLDMLLLHTYADTCGTNDDAWSGWKESLIRQLHYATSLYLEDRGAYDSRTKVPSKAVRERVTGKLPEDFSAEVAAHFELMPKRYFLFRSASAISRHLKAIRKFLLAREKTPPESTVLPTLAWHDRPERGSSELFVCSEDRPGLLAMITGALSANGINVLGADLYVRGDGITLDVFRVCTTDFSPVTDKTLRKAVSKLVKTAFTDTSFDFFPLILETAKKLTSDQIYADSFPTRAWATNRDHPDYTVIELQARDRIGLLYDAFRTVADFGYNVEFARINTEKGAAVDTFYLTTSDGEKIATGKSLEELRLSLERFVSLPASVAP